MDISEIIKVITGYLDVPAMVLLLLLLAGWKVINLAQQRPDFDFSNMLKDDAGKESALRMGIFISLAISSWFVVYDTIHNKQGDSQVLLVYLCVWSGAKVADKLADAVLAKWSK